MSIRRFMLDTNVASFLIRRTSPHLERKAQRAAAALCLSAISLAEIRFGLDKKRDAHALRLAADAFIERIEIVAWDRNAAEIYGSLRASLERKGTPLEAFDLMIAAHALAAGCVLVTGDRGFARVPSLAVEDWTKP